MGENIKEYNSINLTRKHTELKDVFMMSLQTQLPQSYFNLQTLKVTVSISGISLRIHLSTFKKPKGLISILARTVKLNSTDGRD